MLLSSVIVGAARDDSTNGGRAPAPRARWASDQKRRPSSPLCPSAAPPAGTCRHWPPGNARAQSSRSILETRGVPATHLWSHACGTASGKCGANTDPGAAGGAAGHEGDDDILLRGGPPKRKIPHQSV